MRGGWIIVSTILFYFFPFSFLFWGGPKSVIWPREMCRPQRLRDSFLSFFLRLFCTYCTSFKFFAEHRIHTTGESWKNTKNCLSVIFLFFTTCCWARRWKENPRWIRLMLRPYRPLFRAFSSSLNKLCELPLCFFRAFTMAILWVCAAVENNKSETRASLVSVLLQAQHVSSISCLQNDDP